MRAEESLARTLSVAEMIVSSDLHTAAQSLRSALHRTRVGGEAWSLLSNLERREIAAARDVIVRLDGIVRTRAEGRRAHDEVIEGSK